MIIQVPCIHPLDVRIGLCDHVRESVNPVDQDSQKQEIREYDDPFVPQFGDLFEAGFNKWESDA